AVASCDEPDVHILTAQLYDPAGACVGASNGVDVVQGPSTGDNCSPSCLSIASGDGSSVYVTTVCPPFPQDYGVETEDTTDGAADPCIGAFGAYAAYEDSGVTCPPPEDEAGSDGAQEAGDDGGASPGDGGTDGGDGAEE
ncbi:MAG TPA: hypothetical protein VHS09_05115, partial [Polyangiaceae bacterium]|nr:hypothetical protein [Polyangiaceae bacterium]